MAHKAHLDYEDFEPVRIKNEKVLAEKLGDPSAYANIISRPQRLMDELQIQKNLLCVFLVDESKVKFVEQTLANHLSNGKHIVF